MQKKAKIICVVFACLLEVAFFWQIGLRSTRPERQATLAEPKGPSDAPLYVTLDFRPLKRRTAIFTVFECTAYCTCQKCCGAWSDGVTASGHTIAPGDRFVAAPAEIPFGTLISIPGYNGGAVVPVLDRGGAIKGARLDLYFDTHAEALKFGRQIKHVLIYEINEEIKQ